MKTRTALIAAVAAAFALSACTNNPETNRNIALGTAAVAAVGAGAYALSKHNNNEDKKQQEEYQRGYDDARANRRQTSDGEYYLKGYRDGRQEERSDRRDQRAADRYNRHGDRVNVSDLVGARGSSGEQEMKRRGFENIDGRKGWRRSYTTWFNDRSNQCVQITTADGRYQQVREVSANECR